MRLVVLMGWYHASWHLTAEVSQWAVEQEVLHLLSKSYISVIRAKYSNDYLRKNGTFYNFIFFPSAQREGGFLWLFKERIYYIRMISHAHQMVLELIEDFLSHSLYAFTELMNDIYIHTLSRKQSTPLLNTKICDLHSFPF